MTNTDGNPIRTIKSKSEITRARDIAVKYEH